MTTITPSTSPSPAGVTAAAPSAPASAPNAVVTQLPPQLQHSGPGAVISGTVISRDSHGQTQLQTDSGVVTFKTSAQLAVGSQVTLQVQAAGSQLQAVVLSARAPTAAPTTTTLPTLAAAITSGPTAPVVTSIGTGPVIMATVIGPAGTPVPGLPTAAGGATAPFASLPGTYSPPAGQSGVPVSGLSPASASAPALPAAPGAGASPTPVSLSPGTAAVAFAVASAPPGKLPIPPIATPAAATPADVAAATLAAPAARSLGAPAAQTPAQAPTGASPASSGISVSAPSAAAPLIAAGATPAVAAPAAAARYTAIAVNPAQQAGPALAGRAAAPALPAASLDPAAPLSRDAAARPPLALPATPAGSQLQMTYVGPTSTTVLPGMIVGTMRGHTPAGQAIFDTAIGRLALTLPAGVGTHPEGSLIAFQIMEIAARPAHAAGTSVSLATRALTLGHEWPALKAAIGALAEIDPPLARQIADVSLPRPGHPRFLGQILSFIAMPAQDARVLLGEAAMASLERAGRQDLILRLDGDLRDAARLNASSNDWRMFFVPIVDANEMRQLRLFTRRRAPTGGKDRDGGARFVVEVDFEELGPLQLDGLVQKPRIDLILRSHAELPRDMRAGIIDVFEKTCGAAGFNGQIFFQAVPAFPVSPLDEMTKGSRPGVEV